MSKAHEVSLFAPSLPRIASVLFAVTALVWAVTVFPNLSDPEIPRIAERVARGEKYDPDLLRRILAGNLQAGQQQCNTKTLRELLVLQIAAADESVRGSDLQQGDRDIAAVDTVSKSLLACAPAESLGWFGLYWSSIRQEGFGPRAASYLAQSYRLAPHEAWIQLIRAPLALRSFEALSPALKEAAAQDFEDILRAQLFPSAAMILKTGPAARAALLERTCKLPENERLLLQHFVVEAGSNIRHHCYPSSDQPSYMRE